MFVGRLGNMVIAYAEACLWMRCSFLCTSVFMKNRKNYSIITIIKMGLSGND